MKKTLLLIATVLCCAMTMFAQNNHKISYQAVVRDTANKLVANETVTVTVNIYNGEVTTTSTVTEPVYTQTQTVTTNLNGLISLMIGPDVATPAWNSIHWNHARIETTVTLDGTELGLLAMPLTAVPYALYAKEINPDAVVITNIYNKMQQDSTALADKMHADSLLLHGALNDSTANVRRALKDSVTNVNTRMQTMAENLHNEISTLDNKVTTRMNSISDSVKTTLDSVTTVSTNLHNEITAVSTDMQTNYAKLAGANTFTGNNTFSGNNTFTGPVTASSVTVTCGNSNLDICTMYNELTQLIAGMQNTIDSLKDVITELLPSLSLKGTKDTVFTNGNTVDVTYTANFSNANSTDYTFHWTVDGTAVTSTSNPYTHPYTTIGTHKVICTATRTGYATLTDSITTTINKGTPVVTAPTAKNLTYNTNAQTLVNAGTTTGGTLYYNVTTTNSKPAADASDWSTTLPKGTDAGTYYVWYKVVGGDNYNNVDVSNTSVAVTIAKAAGSISYSTTSVTKNAGDAAFTNPLTKVGDGTVTYSISNNGSSCSINSSGQVTVGNSAGTDTITATVTDGANYSYATKTATYTLTVQAADPIVVNSTFQYCYDCQRYPAYPVSGSSCNFSGFSNPLVGNGTTTGPWKLEYIESCTSNNNTYNIDLDSYKSTYNIQSVPIFDLLQWDATQNDFVHAAYGVVCAYSNVTGNVDHTAFFEANGGLGCYLTGQSHSSSLDLTFDEYLSSGLNSLIPNNTLSCLSVSKGSTDLSSDICLYYVPGDTFEQALNRDENKNGELGWGYSSWSGHVTIFYKEVSDQARDLSVDGEWDFATGLIRMNTEIDPSRNYVMTSSH